jgi:hypothetical protein
MSTHPITRTSPLTEYDRRNRDLAAAHNAEPPDPLAWISMLCHRCEQPFKFQGIARHCVRCISGAAFAGVVGCELIGEVSGV